MREFKPGDRVKLDASFRDAKQGTVIALHDQHGWKHVEILWGAQTGFAHPDNLELCETEKTRKDEVLERLCQLSRDVQTYAGFSHAADCFCNEAKGFATRRLALNFEFSETVLQFIERATREAIKTYKPY